MDQKLNWKSFFQKHGLPIGIVILLGLLPFWEFFFSDNILMSSDQVAAPAWKFYFDNLRAGNFPLWNPHLLGGMPTTDAMWGDHLYPPFIVLGFVLPVEVVVSSNFVLHTVIAGICSYVLMTRYFHLGRWGSVALAVSYMLNPHFISYIYGGHTGKFHIMAWLPLGLFFLLKSLNSKYRWFHLLGLSLSIALFVLTSHLQFTYYVLMGFFLIYAYKVGASLRRKLWKKVGSLSIRFWIPILLGIGIAFPLFYPPIKYNTEFSIRGTGSKQTYEHATSWSIHPEELASFVVPEFTGINENYWGRNFFKLNTEYPGVVLLLLGFMGLWLYRKPWMWFWVIVAAIVTTFALGANTPVFKLYYHLIPGIKNFRAPSMMSFWFLSAFLMLSGYTLSLLFRKEEQDDKKSELFLQRVQKIQIAGYGFSGFLLLCAVAPETFYSIWNSIFDVETARNFAKQMGNLDAFREGSIRVAIICAVLTWSIMNWGIRSSQKTKLFILLLLVSVVDLMWINKNFISTYDVSRSFPKEPIFESVLKKDTSEFRVFGFPQAYTRGYTQYHGVEDIGGFADHENRLFREYRGEPYNANPNLMRGLKQNIDGTISGSPFLDLLNVKYILVRDPRTRQLQYAINESVLPRVSFYTSWEVVGGDKALENMKSPGFDPKKILYVQQPEKTKIESNLNARPVNTSILKGELNSDLKQYTVSVDQPGILMLADVYFPHWNVTVNGENKELLRVNHLFRGVYLTPGHHEVVFEYKSPWIRTALWVSIMSLIGLFIFVFIFRKINSPPKTNPTA
jgi:hypothetical protein